MLDKKSLESLLQTVDAKQLEKMKRTLESTDSKTLERELAKLDSKKLDRALGQLNLTDQAQKQKIEALLNQVKRNPSIIDDLKKKL